MSRNFKLTNNGVEVTFNHEELGGKKLAEKEDAHRLAGIKKSSGVKMLERVKKAQFNVETVGSVASAQRYHSEYDAAKATLLKERAVRKAAAEKVEERLKKEVEAFRKELIKVYEAAAEAASDLEAAEQALRYFPEEATFPATAKAAQTAEATATASMLEALLAGYAKGTTGA